MVDRDLHCSDLLFFYNIISVALCRTVSGQINPLLRFSTFHGNPGAPPQPRVQIARPPHVPEFILGQLGRAAGAINIGQKFPERH